MSEIQPGDVVCLKSGSPYMTVSAIKDNQVFCWHVNPDDSSIVTYRSISIPLVVLMKLDALSLEEMNANCEMVLNAVALSRPSRK